MSTTVDSRTRATGTGKPRQKAQLSDRARSERKLGWLLAGPAWAALLFVAAPAFTTPAAAAGGSSGST